MLTGKTLKSYYDRLQSIKTGSTDINEYPELREDYIEESTKVEKLSDLSDDEKARIEDVLSRRDKNMPDGMKNRKRHPILMFDKNGQYHGSYASVSDAEEKIKRVGDTEGWINGPRLVQVDESLRKIVGASFDVSSKEDLEEAEEASLTKKGEVDLVNSVNEIVNFVDSEMKGSTIEFTAAYNYWIHDQSADFISEDLREIVGASFDVSSKEDLEESFNRLPGHVINNELYVLNREIDTFTKGQLNGNDFDETAFNSFIRQMQKIKKEAKKFNSEEDVPVSYQYKK